MWLFEQEGRLLLVVPVPPEPSCTECHLPTPCAPEGLGVKRGVSKDPRRISGTLPTRRKVNAVHLQWTCSVLDQCRQVTVGRAVPPRQPCPSTEHRSVTASVPSEEVWAHYSPGSGALPELRTCRQPHHLPTLESPPFCGIFSMAFLRSLELA